MAKDKLYLPYSLVRNTLPESDGYHRALSHVRSIDGETLFAEVASKIPGQTAAGAELAWESIVETVEENLTKHQYRTSVNGVTFALAVPGSTDAINGLPDEGAYVSISLPDELRNIDASVTPVYSSEEKDVPKVATVESMANREPGVVIGREPFRLGGVNLTAAGDDETITVVAGDGTEAMAEEISEDGLGSFITARLATALPPGKGKVVLKTHGKRTPEGELRTLVKSVTILAGEPAPEPHVPTATWEGTLGTSGGELAVGGEAGAQLAALYESDPSAAYARVKLTDPEGEEISCPLQATDGKLVVSASVSAGCQPGDVYTLAVQVEDSAGTLVTLSHEYTVTEA